MEIGHVDAKIIKLALGGAAGDWLVKVNAAVHGTAWGLIHVAKWQGFANDVAFPIMPIPAEVPLSDTGRA